MGYCGNGGDPVTRAAAGDWQLHVTCVPTVEHGHGDPFGTVCIAPCMCVVLA